MKTGAAPGAHAGWLGAGGLAAALAAAASWVCCLPFVAGAVGLAAASGAASLGVVRPWLAAVAVGFFAFAFYGAYRPEPCAEGEACAPSKRGGLRVFLWVAAVASLLLLTLPRWSSWVLYWLA